MKLLGGTGLIVGCLSKHIIWQCLEWRVYFCMVQSDYFWSAIELVRMWFILLVGMGGRKLRLSVKRKRHKKDLHGRIVTGLKLSIPVKFTVKLPPLCVSLPISSYCDAPCADVNTLRARIKSCSPLPSTWVINATDSDSDSPLILCKLKTFQLLPPKINVSVTLSINEQREWNIIFLQPKLDPANCCILNDLAATVSSVSSLVTILSRIDSSKVCVGNPDTDILQMWHQRSLTLHGSNGIVCHSIITYITQCAIYPQEKLHLGS